MLDQFSGFKKELQEILNLNNIGVKIQNERYRRDRKDWIFDTLKGAFVNDENDILINLLDNYLDKTEPIAGDYGSWGDLLNFQNYIRNSDIPYYNKSKLYFFTAAIAAQQIEFGLIKTDESIPYLYEFVKEFFILSEENSILLSANGYIYEKYSLTGIIKIKSIQGKISIQVFKKEKNTSEIIEKLSNIYGWNYQSLAMNNNSKYNSFWGLSKFEIYGYFHSFKSNNYNMSFQSFIESVYPIWLPKSLGITTSFYCNARCAHCYNASSPENKKKFIEWKQIKSNITEWVSMGLNEVGISGGEPFQFPVELVELVQELKNLKIEKIIPFSNGFLGKDDLKLCNILKQLKSVGFGNNAEDHVKISTGQFHLPFISVEHILNFAKRHYEIIGNKCLFDIEVLENNEYLKDIISKAKEYNIAHIIEWKYRSKFSKSGRAKSLLKINNLTEPKLSDLKCPVRNRAAVYPDIGWVYCTGTIYPKKHISFSKLEELSIYEIFAKAHFDDKFIFLSLGSFEDYLKYKNSNIEDHKFKMDNNSTPCSLCSKVYN
ncbi:radical SAM protein [Pigmentibacter ruber]|uniref:radical SAM protein n=1 Tax=Pigmentibacter ruber TaxID=2683196 RepID=UPI00131CF6D4|nr:radical SAM protein [Pigmentibacter ruber]